MQSNSHRSQGNRPSTKRGLEVRVGLRGLLGPHGSARPRSANAEQIPDLQRVFAEQSTATCTAEPRDAPPEPGGAQRALLASEALCHRGG